MSSRSRLGIGVMITGALSVAQFATTWIGRATVPEDAVVAAERFGAIFRGLTAIEWLLPVTFVGLLLAWIFLPDDATPEDEESEGDVGMFAAFEFMVTGYWHSSLSWTDKDTQAAEARFIALARAGRLSVWGKPHADSSFHDRGGGMELISSDYWNNATLDMHHLFTRRSGRTGHISPYDMFDSDRSRVFYSDIRVNRAQIKREFRRSWLRKIRYRWSDFLENRKARNAKNPQGRT